MTDNGLQFMSNFFANLCATMSTELAAAPEYQSQVGGQVGKLKQALVPPLHHYIVRHQSDRGSYMQLLAYSYTTREQHTSKTFPFSLVIIRKHPSAIKKKN